MRNPIQPLTLALGATLMLASSDALAQEARKAAPELRAERREAVLVEHIARRYFVAHEAAGRAVAAAFRAAGAVGLDPLLVLAVISVESRFNPVAQSAMGAKGLMQIIPRFHREKLAPYGGEQAVLQPESNIEVGSRILQEYVHRTGSLEAGLQYYNGAFSDGSARYARRVMAERARLELLLREKGTL